jgi:osmotically inducible protein OsmC
MPIDVRYLATATATGGRDGNARTDDGRLEIKLATPKELGGPGGPGTNPEQLFAAGYSACFLGALKVAGHQLKMRIPTDTTVNASVGIGPRSAGGFGIEVDLVVATPGIDGDAANLLLQAADQICTYSNATRNNIDVDLAIAPYQVGESLNSAL